MKSTILCHWGNCLGESGRFILACAVFAAAASWYPPALAAAGAPLSGRVAVNLRGIPYTVEGLTGVSFRAGLAACEEATRKWPGEKVSGQGGFYLMLRPWSRHRTAARSLYFNLLQQAVDDFLASRLIDSLDRKYHPNFAGFINLVAMHKAALTLSLSNAKYFRLLSRAMVRNWRPRGLVARLNRSISGGGFEAQYFRGAFWRYCKAHRAYIFALAHAFPRWEFRNSRPTAFSIDMASLARAQTDIGIIIQRHPGQFERVASRRYGSWAFLALFSTPASRKTGNEFRCLAGLLAPSGRVLATSRISAAAAALRDMGALSRLGAGLGDSSYLNRLFGVRPEQLHCRAVIPFTRGLHGGTGYIFLANRHVPKPFKYAPRNLRPGGIVFAAAESYLLLPLAHRLLAGTTMGAGLRLPSARYLIKWACQGENVLACSSPLPQWLIRHPWDAVPTKK